MSLLVGPQDVPPGAVLLDVRWRLAPAVAASAAGRPSGRSVYAAGHLPGARFVDLDADLADPPGPRGRHPLPAPEHFQAAMRLAGVRQDRPVVVYDDAGATVAARAWWLLRYFGHRDVAVLDGGIAAWTAAGRPLESGEPPPPEPGDFVAVPGGMPLLDADGAAAIASAGSLLDARSAERYRGEAEPIDPVAGHIPGAVSAPTTDNLDPRGRFLTADALRARFAALGVDLARPVGAYCGSGVTAAHEVLALALSGVPAALYVGSWSEWVSDRGRPVARGAGRVLPGA